ncbi:hypothetical protein J2129_000894 [Methanofollis sp. W23]|uniref:hypothetical protein n=1 Tax=Methanofollis sp. W23 TaxID=2817849 RepID=UPI001D1EB62E|nr:hypothetical protein [Methanofollis sp. W23]MBP2145440.1 hypothetical protein [Methanofollis sp. W23]
MTQENPVHRSRLFRDVSLPLTIAILILVGTLLVLLGLLLFPVNLGVIPFSPDGQLGLLMVIMAIQMMALGETPMGQYTRSWFLMIVGVVFAAMGVVSCIVPGVLTGVIQVLLGLLNILGGGVLLTKRFLSLKDGAGTPVPGPLPPTIKNLLVTQTVLNFVAIAFGITMLIPGLVSGMVIAGIVVVNGLLLFVLGGIITKIP